MLLSLLFLFFISPSFSTEIKWSWRTESPEANYYRYQLNGEKEDSWTVVESTVTSIILPATEGINRLYLEASYDGIRWSDTAVGTYLQEKSYTPKRFELSLKAAPYAFQDATYTIQNDPELRTTSYGNMSGLGFSSNLNTLLGITANINIEWYRYENFHFYRDFQTDIRLRLRVLESDNSQIRVYINFGGGLDSVWRDDGDLGFYPLLVYGFEDVVMLGSNYSIGWGWDFAHTFQNGSKIFQLVPYVSLAFHWGGSL